MIALRKLSETSRTITLEWDPVPGAIGYRFQSAASQPKWTHTFDPSRTEIKFSKAAWYKVEALGTKDAGQYPAVTPSPPPPPPTGTVREALPGQALSMIDRSTIGETVYCRGGVHPKLTLAKSFSGGQVIVKCEPGTYFQGIDTAGADGYLFDDLVSRVPVNFTDYNSACFYHHWDSCDITLKNPILVGGFLCFKQYAGGAGTFRSAKRTKIIGGDFSGAGGDIIHLDGYEDFLIDGTYIHDPVDQGGEHHDGIQTQGGDGLHITAATKISWPVSPRRDSPNQGVFLRQALPNNPITNTLLEKLQIVKWYGGRAIQIMDGVQGLKMMGHAISDSGNGTTSPKITIGDSPYPMSGIELWDIPASDVYFGNQAGRDATTFRVT